MMDGNPLHLYLIEQSRIADRQAMRDAERRLLIVAGMMKQSDRTTHAVRRVARKLRERLDLGHLDDLERRQPPVEPAPDAAASTAETPPRHMLLADILTTWTVVSRKAVGLTEWKWALSPADVDEFHRLRLQGGITTAQRREDGGSVLLARRSEKLTAGAPA